jgi:hypothetical protein
VTWHEAPQVSLSPQVSPGHSLILGNVVLQTAFVRPAIKSTKNLLFYGRAETRSWNEWFTTFTAWSRVGQLVEVFWKR